MAQLSNPLIQLPFLKKQSISSEISHVYLHTILQIRAQLCDLRIVKLPPKYSDKCLFTSYLSQLHPKCTLKLLAQFCSYIVVQRQVPHMNISHLILNALWQCFSRTELCLCQYGLYIIQCHIHQRVYTHVVAPCQVCVSLLLEDLIILHILCQFF